LLTNEGGVSFWLIGSFAVVPGNENKTHRSRTPLRARLHLKHPDAVDR